MTEDQENEIHRDIARRACEFTAQDDKEAYRDTVIVSIFFIVVGLVLYFSSK